VIPSKCLKNFICAAPKRCSSLLFSTKASLHRIPKATNTHSVYIILLYAFFWVIPRRLNFISQRFGTLCLFHLHRRVGMKQYIILHFHCNNGCTNAPQCYVAVHCLSRLE
jgi:hypothetical protein